MRKTHKTPELSLEIVKPENKLRVVEEEVIRQELKNNLSISIEELNDSHKKVIREYLNFNGSREELAIKLGLTPNYLNVIMFRAIKKLRRKLT